MPIIKIKHLVSVSSEDQNHPASNILKEDKKWKCASGGQNKVSVILQFEKSSKISGVDIGNEGSAFIEVLVGRMSDVDADFKVILGASSFMSPLESRNGDNTNRVRLFGLDKLCKETVESSWDQAKIVCTQPYNKSAQYGLSFIKFHSPFEPQQTDIKKTCVGSFTIREEKDEPVLPPGSLFAQKKASPHTSGTFEVRQTSLKQESLIPKKKMPILTDKVPSPKTQPTTASPVTTKPRKRSTDSQPADVSSHKKARNKEGSKDVVFEKIMSGVVFVLSGFVNPLRGELRDKAIEMGAKYKPDWDDTSTHLICAFANTPKFNQVKKLKSIIVSKEWILDCHKKRRQLSSSDYSLISANSDNKATVKAGNEVKSPKQTNSAQKDVKVQNVAKQHNHQNMKAIENVAGSSTNRENIIKSEDIDEYGGSTDVDSDNDKAYDSETEVDSDEENARSLRLPSEVNRHANGKGCEDEEANSLPQLPNYFGGRMFFMLGDFEEEEKRKLLRYIVAFNGKLTETMKESVDYVVTASSWNEQFDKALKCNKNVIFVKPSWVLDCGKKGKMVPFQPYIVSSS